MAVDTNLNFQSLFESLKVEDPWLPPRTWESTPSQSQQTQLPSRCSAGISSSVSEASLVRLAMNALQGLESALISVENLSAAFCSDPSDRTFHQIPSLWNRFSSTHVLGKILRSIGCVGFLVFLLHKFVDHFTELGIDETFNQTSNQPKLEECKSNDDRKVIEKRCSQKSLVNQAFAVALRKILEGYMCALDSLHASVGLRRTAKVPEASFLESSVEGCLMSVVHSEITLLEVYLHTRELRIQIEVLGNICNLHNIANCFSLLPFQDLIDKATSEFCNFHRGGDLLTYLYTQLQVADPAHCAVLKFLFLRSCEPYCAFIRSWIYKAEVVDPYAEFVVEYVDVKTPNLNTAGVSSFPVACTREREGASIPCFMKELLLPLLRAGQQLQVLVKLLELGTSVATAKCTCDDFLPCWTGFSSNHMCYESVISFSKEDVEARVSARNIYYDMMQKKFDNLSTKMEFRCEQVVPDDAVSMILAHVGGRISAPLSIESGSSIVVTEVDRRSSIMLKDKTDHDDSSSSLDATDVAVDMYDSPGCQSSISCEDQIEFDQRIEPYDSMGVLKENHFSSLSFSKNTLNINSLRKPSQREGGVFHVGSVLEKTFTKIDDVKNNALSSSDTSLFFDLANWSWNSDATCTGYSDMDSLDFDIRKDGRNYEVHFGGISLSRKRIGNTSVAKDDSLNNQLDNIPRASNLFMLQPQNHNYCSNFFSLNPMVTRNAFLPMMRKPDQRQASAFGQSFPFFDFSAVEDPCRVRAEKILPSSGAESLCGGNSQGPATNSKSNDSSERECGGDIFVDNTISYNDRENISTNVSGGRSWETTLCTASKRTVDKSAEGQRLSCSGLFELPLDFVIHKCLVQEIILQYTYVSKLTVKLLDEGFDLQGHLHALRRYHFMELADWADSFITSLWNHKWCVIEADSKLQDIQSYLELSVQKSSCEHDRNKDRLFVYIKEQCTLPLSKATIGIDSFEFLGLGYQVEWPINIILTPASLKIYAEIFSFHVKVKLAGFSLTKVWSSLKDMVILVRQNRHSKLINQEIQHFNVLVKTRHEVNHFVCVLQHYVESQLSHLSWCRFLQSLQLKAKDMMDLESMHMAYLTDALHTCFLSEETRSVAGIINQILQCALDLRCCFTGDMWNTQVDNAASPRRLSGINKSQILAVKKRFDKNMKELHLFYLKSPKVGEFGLSRLWESLDYNYHYSDTSNEMSYAFSV
ncbi:gamma-tubulin complex component 6 isoform X2 [Benincasa hispida]|uniref:gamma-tubulin complex component 6 isoform X2 n=1 Tax=Benincasa hispida TaxID=102211 RepID=UPI001900DD7C|nr:gamma-tubulin complex component 6 isoform X2 [Benincasa hispida]